jgi:hypothetical protein
MATTISTDLGEYVIYHISEAGIPSAHDTTDGEWFFQPADVNDGEAFSNGYPTEQAATDAARDYVANEMGAQGDN